MDLKFHLGKYKSSNSYTKRADQVITNVGFILPFIMTAYGLLIQFKIIPSTNNHTNYIGFGIIMFLWFLTGTYQKIKPGNTPLSSMLRFFQFYTMSALYLLLVSGINSPFVACWPILMLASYTYFDKNGLYVGIIIFTIIVLIDIFILNYNAPTVIGTNIMIYVYVMTTGLAVVAFTRTHEKRKEILFKTAIKESLQRDRVATIINNLSDAVISTDIDGKINTYNAACLSLLDTNLSLEKKDVDQILPLTNIDGKPVNILKELKKSKAVVRRDDMFFAFNDGEKIRLEVTYAPIRNGFSTSKSVEEERNEFISVISHELRTPITITEGSLSNIQSIMDHKDTTTKMIEDSITVAHDQVLFLSNIVNDLSTLSHIERGVDNNPEIIDVKEFANNMISHFSDSAKNKKISLKLSISPKISKVFVSQIYLNELIKILLNNAIKYTKKGTVDFNVKESSNLIIFSVKDTGLGIREKEQQKIFEKFYQVEDYRTREIGGAGLGLHVAATIAEKLDTKIDLESTINVGSTFSFSIPVFKEKGSN